MDDPGIDDGAHRAALSALRRVNRWLRVEQRLIRVINGAVRQRAASILDVGTGSGGLMQCALQYARRNGIDWQVCALDRSTFALGEARKGTLQSEAHTEPRISIPFGIGTNQHESSSNSRLFASIRGSSPSEKIACTPERCGCFVAADALHLPFADRSFDVVACSLLLHHFDSADAVAMLRESARVCRSAVVIGDLDRSRLAWAMTWLVTRVTSRSHIFHVDGPRSVRAAYRPAEARALAAQAGLDGSVVHAVFPLRWLLFWRKSV